MRCGHEEPSREETSQTAQPDITFSKIYNLQLFSNDTARIEFSGNILVKKIFIIIRTGPGRWSMMKDLTSNFLI
jgi:hypothetical protein